MLQLSDGFDSHAPGATDLSLGDAGWGAVNGLTIEAGGGKFGAQMLRRQPDVDGYVPFSNPGTEKGFAAYFQLATPGGAFEADLLSTSAAVGLLSVNEDGDLIVRDGSGAQLFVAAAAISFDVWAWIEVIYTSTGVQLYVSNLPAGTYTGSYSALGDDFQLLGAAPAGTPTTDVDDFITWDSSGTAFSGFPIGPRRIVLHTANGAGAATQWTPAFGTNHAAVTAPDWDGGAGVTAESAALKDLYTLTDLPHNPAVINAVVVKSVQENLGDNAARLQHVIRAPGGTEQTGPLAVASTAGLAPLKTVFYQDPLGANWTASALNSLEAGQQSSN